MSEKLIKWNAKLLKEQYIKLKGVDVICHVMCVIVKQ